MNKGDLQKDILKIFIYSKIFDDCVVLLKTCYIVIVCHDLPSLQKYVIAILI